MKSIQYYAPPRKPDLWDLHIRRLGIQEKVSSRIIERPRGSGDYLFVVFYDAVWIRCQGKIRQHPPGTLFIWKPGDYHYYGDRENTWHHSWIHCAGRLVGRFLAMARVPTGRPIRLPNPSLIEKYLLEVHQELTDYERADRVIVQNILHNWIREIGRVVRQQQRPPSVPPALLALKSYIEANYHEAQTLPGMALRAHLSVPHLCSQFKSFFGMSVIGYLIHLRLQHASYLLLDRNLRVKEIAQQVGYDDICYFSKLFKKHYGVSPTTLRSNRIGVKSKKQIGARA